MNIKGMKFGRVFTASGAQGFYGEGWWYHKYLRPFGLSFDGATFIAKTVTHKPKIGNLTEDKFPKCIVTNFAKGASLNAVGLTNNGVRAYLSDWAAIRRPFLISFACVGNTLEEKLDETWGFTEELVKVLHRMNPEIGIQFNLSCPNVDSKSSVSEIKRLLEPLQYLRLPLIIKVNALFPSSILMELESRIDAVSVSNSLPWNSLPDELKISLFGQTKSPLEHLGGGGLSGKPLLPYTLRSVGELKWLGFSKPIIAGGGIMSQNSIVKVFEAGADAVEIGSAAFLRPWRIKRMIDFTNSNF